MKSKAGIRPGGESFVEGIIFETSLWCQIRFCKRRGGRDLGQGEGQVSRLRGHLQIEVIKVRTCPEK